MSAPTGRGKPQKAKKSKPTPNPTSSSTNNLPLFYQEPSDSRLDSPFIILYYDLHKTKIEELLKNSNYTDLCDIMNPYLQTKGPSIVPLNKNEINNYTTNQQINAYNFNTLFQLYKNNNITNIEIKNKLINLYEDIHTNPDNYDFKILFKDIIYVLQLAVKNSSIKNENMTNILQYHNSENVNIVNNSIKNMNKTKIITKLSGFNLGNIASNKAQPTKNFSTININKIVKSTNNNITRKTKINFTKKAILNLLNKINLNNSTTTIIKGGALLFSSSSSYKVTPKPTDIDQDIYDQLVEIYGFLKDSLKNGTFVNKAKVYNTKIITIATKLKTVSGIPSQKLYKILEIFYIMKKVYEKMPKNEDLLNAIYNEKIQQLTTILTTYTGNISTFTQANLLPEHKKVIYDIKNSVLKYIKYIQKKIEINDDVKKKILPPYVTSLNDFFKKELEDTTLEVSSLTARSTVTQVAAVQSKLTQIINDCITRAKQIVSRIYKMFTIVFFIYEKGEIPTISNASPVTGTAIPQVTITSQPIPIITSTSPIIETSSVITNTQNKQTRVILLKIIKLIYDLLPEKLQLQFLEKMKRINNKNIKENKVAGKLNRVIQNFLKK